MADKSRYKKRLEYRDLNGPEKLLLFQNIRIPALLPSLTQAERIQKLWEDFMDIIGDLTLDYNNEDEVQAFKVKVSTWLKKFTERGMYQAKTRIM